MNIPVSQQVTAIFARNHFREVWEKAKEDGICYIIKKSKPEMVLIPLKEFQKIKNPVLKKKKTKKITRKFLDKNPMFSKEDLERSGKKYKELFGHISAVELCKKCY